MTLLVVVTMLRYVLLALLADGQPAHGYGLMKAYAERSGIKLSIGNVYRELQRLLTEGLIATVSNPADADARRAPYVITDAGRDILASWLAAPAYTLAYAPPDPLSYRLALLGDFEPSQVEAFLEDLHGELWSQTKVVERERASVSRVGKEDEQMLSMRSILLGRRARYLAADLDMVEEMRTRVTTWRSRSVTKPRAGASARDAESVRRSKARSDDQERS